jgi:hypothetical protein
MENIKVNKIYKERNSKPKHTKRRRKRRMGRLGKKQDIKRNLQNNRKRRK